MERRGPHDMQQIWTALRESLFFRVTHFLDTWGQNVQGNRAFGSPLNHAKGSMVGGLISLINIDKLNVVAQLSPLRNLQ